MFFRNLAVLASFYLIQPTISLEMPVPSQVHYGFHSFPVVGWFVCLYTYEFWLSLCKIVRSLVIVLLSLFVSMDLIYENLTFRGILFLMFSILRLTHSVTHALESLSFMEMQKLHVITFFLLSYINQECPFFSFPALKTQEILI